jgi:hypothetical protein
MAARDITAIRRGRIIAIGSVCKSCLFNRC